MPPDQKIVIGIDFGTTYSGVAWGDSAQPNEIHTIRKWPGSVSEVDKVSSSMLYHDGAFKWGEDADLVEGRLQFMKLLLDPSQERNCPLADPLGLKTILDTLPTNKKPVDAVADYLRSIKTHALAQLALHRGTGFERVIPMEYHLTVPAVWSESARALTLKAANQAGIGTSQDLVLIPEPEAAALHCLTTLPNIQKTGDVFVVVDCGGGTVDLISYKVLALEPKFEVKEVSVGGGLCGSVFLNRRFEKMVRERLGHSTLATWLNKPRGKKHYAKMINDFDKLKCNFKGSRQTIFAEVSATGLSNDDAKGVADQFMAISGQDLQEIFEPVIKEIIRLIQEQIDKVIEADMHVSSVIMVGGFGANEYLRHRVEELAKAQKDRGKLATNFELLCPNDSWTSVVKGAVITGLQTVGIRSRKARRNYGVVYATKYEPAIHQEFQPFVYLHKYYQCPFVGGLMRWYVRNGDEIVGTKQVSFPFCRQFDKRDSDMGATMTLYASDSAHAEELLFHHEVYEVCSIVVDMSPLRGSLCESRNSAGRTYFILSFIITMTIHSAQLKFGVEDDDGNPCGATTTVTFI